MKKNIGLYILSVVSVLEACLILVLIFGYHKGVHLVVKSRPVISSPLELALEYQSPDQKFEELVKANPSWIKFREPLPDGTQGMSILASCAVLNLTNHVRILLENGADVEEANRSLGKIGAGDAISLIREVDKGLKEVSPH